MKDQFATSKALTLALLDAAIAEIDAVADAEAEYARKIANALALYLVENETADTTGFNLKRTETTVSAQEDKETKIARAAEVKIISEGKAHLVALVSSAADYAKYFLSYVGVEVVYLSSTVVAEVTYFGAAAAANKQLHDNLTAAEDTFDAEYCRLTSRYQEALSIVHTGGTVDAEFFESGAASMLVQVCFPAGFEVDLTDGTTKKIEDFEGGEEVWAKDHRNPNGPLVKCKVARAFKNEPKETIKITFDNGLELQATAEHPFWVPIKGWISCESLEIGDSCVNKEGVETKVVSKELVAEAVPVYNIEVEGAHTYFIGKDDLSLLVHNQCGHHVLPYAVLRDVHDLYPDTLSDDALKVASGYYSGPLPGGHDFTGHGEYNKAARELFEEYVKDFAKKNPGKKISGQQMYNFITNHLLPGTDLKKKTVNVLQNFNASVTRRKPDAYKFTMKEAMTKGESLLTGSDKRYSKLGNKLMLKTLLYGMGAYTAYENFSNVARANENLEAIAGDIKAEVERIHDSPGLTDNEKQAMAVSYVNTKVNEYNTNTAVRFTLHQWFNYTFGKTSK